MEALVSTRMKEFEPLRVAVAESAKRTVIHDSLVPVLASLIRTIGDDFVQECMGMAMDPDE